RWSPFFGICLSKSTDASGWTTKGANAVASACGFPAVKRCQCVSVPSPRHDTRPTPVIQASRGASAMAGDSVRKFEPARGALHVRAELVVRERHGSKLDLGIADRLSVGFDARAGHRVARPLVHQA